jgi:hypothetical protein
MKKKIVSLLMCITVMCLNIPGLVITASAVPYYSIYISQVTAFPALFDTTTGELIGYVGSPNAAIACTVNNGNILANCNIGANPQYYHDLYNCNGWIVLLDYIVEGSVTKVELRLPNGVVDGPSTYYPGTPYVIGIDDSDFANGARVSYTIVAYKSIGGTMSCGGNIGLV